MLTRLDKQLMNETYDGWVVNGRTKMKFQLRTKAAVGQRQPVWRVAVAWSACFVLNPQVYRLYSVPIFWVVGLRGQSAE